MDSLAPDKSAVPWRKLLLFLVLPALALRIANVWISGSDPVVRYPFGDGLAYAKWALEISNGDWLGHGRPVFYQAPLYPYILAVMQKLSLGFYPWPQLLNAFAGTATVLLVFLTTRRLFAGTAAWIAGGVAALWGPALMHECLLDKTALGLLMTAASLYALLGLYDAFAAERKTTWRLLGVGFLLGAGALLRENLLLLAPVAALVFAVRFRRILGPSLMLAGVFVALLPAFLHNGLVGGAWLPTSYQGGTNYYIGNHAGASGTYDALIEGRGDPIYEEADARRLAAEALGATAEGVAAGDVQRYWLGRGWSFFASSPGPWLVLQIRKLQLFVFHDEAPDSVPYGAFRAGRPWLLPSRFQFGLLLPLVLVGCMVAWSQGRGRFVMLLGLIACASVVGFFVVSRYRLACLPFLLPFAAAAVLALRGQALRVAVLAAALVPAQVWLMPNAPRIFDAPQQDALLLANRGTAIALWQEDKRPAVASYERALAILPDYRAARRSLTRLLMAPEIHDFRRALPHLEIDAATAPDDAEARHNLGFCLLQLGELARAETELKRALALGGDRPSNLTVHQLARCLEERGKRTEAAQLRARHGFAAPSGR